MEVELTHPKYIYADILIALAQADGNVDCREKELLDCFFDQMDLDKDTIAEMWLTPRTLDVIESLLTDIPSVKFRHCLLKDCFLLAYADEEVQPSENRFIKRMTQVMEIDQDVRQKIHHWVQTSIAQKQLADELFGADGSRIGF